MKTNRYAIIPAEVRYDRALTSTSILLYGEIVAATNAFGVCEEDVGYFAAAMRLDSRSITRCVAQLIENGHLQRITEKGRRKFKTISKPIPLPDDVEVILPPVREDIAEFVTAITKTWEKALSTILDKKEGYEDIIRQRLARVDKDDLVEAVKNRIEFVNASDWHQQPENRQSAVDIMQVLGSDSQLLRWLNSKPSEKIRLIPFQK